MRDCFCFAFHQTWGCLEGLEVTQAPERFLPNFRFPSSPFFLFLGHRQGDHEPAALKMYGGCSGRGPPLGFPKGRNHGVPGLWALEVGLNLFVRFSSTHKGFSQAGGRQELTSSPGLGEDPLVGRPVDTLTLLSPWETSLLFSASPNPHSIFKGAQGGMKEVRLCVLSFSVQQTPSSGTAGPSPNHASRSPTPPNAWHSTSV